MRHPFLIGEKLYLRRIEHSDVSDEYLSWINDQEVTKFLETGKFPITHNQLNEYIKKFESSTNHLLLCIIDIASDQHVGNVTLQSIDWIHQTAETGLLIGRKDFWGKGFAFEAWSLILEYAFNRLGLRKISAGATESNLASAAVLRKLGFQVEGIFRRERLIEGKYEDGIHMGIFRDEFHKFVELGDADSLTETL